MAGTVAPLAIATITLVRDPAEELQLREAMITLSRTGLPIAVADGGSGADFVGFLENLPNVEMVTPDGSGLVSQVRSSVAACVRTGAEFVCYTESDKRQFFDDALAQFATRSTREASGDLTLAARSDESFATFPQVQRFTEGTINRLCAEFLEARGDYSYGPFVMHRDLAPYLERVPADLGWGWRHFIFAIAHRRSRRIVHVVDDFACPPGQRDEDGAERLHRLRQLGQNVNGLMLGLTTSLSSSS